MKTLLHIDASPRGEGSFSRQLSAAFVESWKSRFSDHRVVHRDLGKNPPPHVTEEWTAAAFSPAAAITPQLQSALKVSDELVDELLAANDIVIGVPMYNFSVPSSFKAWIDQIVWAGRTFSFGENGFAPLVHGKKATVVIARGGVFALGSPFAAYNFQEPWIRAILGFIGISDVTFIVAEGLNGAEAAREKSLANARHAIKSTAAL